MTQIEQEKLWFSQQFSLEMREWGKSWKNNNKKMNKKYSIQSDQSEIFFLFNFMNLSMLFAGLFLCSIFEWEWNVLPHKYF